MRVAFLGPAGTFSQEAMWTAPGSEAFEPVPEPTLHETVMAVQDGRAERALVPIENSLEGSVDPTLDTLALETTEDVVILGELVHPIRHCLVAAEPVELATITTVISHPQASGQCARFLQSRLPAATVVPAASTADAVRALTERSHNDGAWAALGTQLAAQLYGCTVLLEGVEDVEGNETRFVWVGRAGAQAAEPSAGRPWRTALVFWGVGAEAPGWLVACLSEFATRGVNLTRIESRPRRQGLGSYMFFVDLDGSEADPEVAEAIAALRLHAESVRILGSFPAAA